METLRGSRYLSGGKIMYCIVAIILKGEFPFRTHETVFLDKARNWVDHQEDAEQFERIEDTKGVGFLPPSQNHEDVEGIGAYKIGSPWLGAIPVKVYTLPG